MSLLLTSVVCMWQLKTRTVSPSIIMSAYMAPFLSFSKTISSERKILWRLYRASP